MDSSAFQIFKIEEIDRQLGEAAWLPKDIASFNDSIFRAAIFKGEYQWHSHQQDELFFVLKGSITIDTEKGPIRLKKGEGAVVPRGIRHRPRAARRALVVMIEPKSLRSLGDDEQT